MHIFGIPSVHIVLLCIWLPHHMGPIISHKTLTHMLFNLSFFASEAIAASKETASVAVSHIRLEPCARKYPHMYLCT